MSDRVDKSVQNQSFLCLSSLCGTKEPLSEVGSILRNAKLSIISNLIKFLSEDYVYIVRTEAAQVLSNIAKNYSDLLWESWDEILKQIRVGLNHNDQSKLNLLNLLNHVFHRFETYLNSNH